MRTLEALIDDSDPAMSLVRQWLAVATRPCEVLAPSENRGSVLVGLQVTTRSILGAIAYETGGLLVDHGWLRILGSGHPKLPRNIVEWNARRSSGYLLVADDVVGGFFAMNGGSLGDDPGSMYYWAPDTLRWEPLGIGYTDFLQWVLSDRISVFHETMRWPNWKSDVAEVRGDQCYNFYPFLWTAEGSVESSSRRLIGIDEQYAVNLELASQLE